MRPRPILGSPSVPVFLVFAAALNLQMVIDPAVQVYAVFVRRLQTIASFQIFFGASDSPHTMRQGNYFFVPRGLMSGLYVSTAGAGQMDLEIVTYEPDGNAPAIEFHEQ